MSKTELYYSRCFFHLNNVPVRQCWASRSRTQLQHACRWIGEYKNWMENRWEYKINKQARTKEYNKCKMLKHPLPSWIFHKISALAMTLFSHVEILLPFHIHHEQRQYGSLCCFDSLGGEFSTNLYSTLRIWDGNDDEIKTIFLLFPSLWATGEKKESSSRLTRLFVFPTFSPTPSPSWEGAAAYHRIRGESNMKKKWNARKVPMRFHPSCGDKRYSRWAVKMRETTNHHRTAISFSSWSERWWNFC